MKPRTELEGIASRIAHTRPRGEPQIPNMTSAQERGAIRQAHTDAHSAWLGAVLENAEDLANDYLAALAELRALNSRDRRVGGGTEENRQ